MSVKISAQDVNNLRKQTGAGMMDCKQALEESNGDFDGAIEYLRKKGQKLSAKRADRETNEGVVIALTSEDQTKGIVINISCETDFVAKNEDFIKFAQGIADFALAKYPSNVDELLALDFNGQVLSEKIAEHVGVIGEKIEIKAYETASAPKVVPYIHAGYRIGVLVSLSKDAAGAEAAGKDVAMQIAAMNPLALNKEGVDASIIEKEIEIGKDIARQEGKPEAMLEKIAEGKLNKFFAENTLLSQKFVKDNSLSVEEFLKTIDKELFATAFKRVSLV